MKKISITLLTLALGVGTTFMSVASQGLDPTKPLTGTPTYLNDDKKIKVNLVLEGIFHGKQVHTVVINGKSMSVNDSIGEYRLVTVNDESVILRSAEERLKLYVFSKKVSAFQIKQSSNAHAHPH
tara:strand:- start:164 stop:538 length:375 start_codon:yes stop_codon:yes gene_type:complete